MTAFEYFERHACILEKDYPYTGDDGDCEARSHKGVTSITRYDKAKKDSSAAMKHALNEGVLAISVDSRAKYWDLYKGGIFPN